MPLKTVYFEIGIEVEEGPDLVERAAKELQIKLDVEKRLEFKAVRVFPDEDVEKLTQEFINSAPEEEPAVVEKELTYSPTREELDALPEPELKPGKKK